jgi:hypothetical protein
MYATNSGGPTDNSYTWTWNFGDGSPVQTNIGSQPNTASHLYALAGNYTATLTYSGGTCSPITTSIVMDVFMVTATIVPSTTDFLFGVPVALNVVTTPSHTPPLQFRLNINSGPNIPITRDVPYMYTPPYIGVFGIVLTGWYSDVCPLTHQIILSFGCPTCAITGISASSPACVGSPTHFVNNVANCTGLGTGPTDKLVYTWDYGDGTTSTGYAPDHTYTAPGTYTVKLTYQFVAASYTADDGQGASVGTACPVSIGGTTTVVVTTCPPPPCEDCIGSFAPTAGNYILGTWVKQDVGENLTTYDKAGVKITCLTALGTIVSGPFYPAPSGKIIDGWQRIEQKINIPHNTTEVKIQLVNTGTTDAFFDDIRIHPLDGNMKTYVYDPISLRLMAELDENNYATFYEYDEEGELIRVKKETERGIMTIKETRKNNSKQ